MAQNFVRAFRRVSALSTMAFLLPMLLPQISSAQTAPLDLTLEAESMSKTTGSGWGTYWGLWVNGQVDANVTFAQEAIHQFTVTAYGTSSGGVWPNLALKIDDVIVAQAPVNSTSPAAYTFNVNVKDGAHKVSLAYTNDANVNGQDRNLILDKVRILQTATQAPSAFPEPPATIEAEKMENKTVGAASGIYWMLWSNGKVENRVNFKAAGSYDVKVIAKGTLAGSLGPNMDILLDDVKVAAKENVGTANATYTFKVNVASAGTHKIGVAFTNDTIINGADRNLYVDKVSIAASGTSTNPTPVPTPTPIPATPTPAPTPAPGGTPGVKYIGRFDFSDSKGPRFSWPGSAIEARFSGTAASVRLTVSADTYFTVLVDQRAPVTIKATSGTRDYALASGLASGTHTVRIVRNNESEQGPTQFLGFTFSGGQLLAPDATRKLRMEVVGDSISAGYGSIGVGPNCPFEAVTSSNFAAYGSVAARALNADVTTIAISGIGAYHNYGGVPNDPNNPPITSHYPLTMFSWSGTYKNMLYDFSSQQPKDIVVINIGTNDFSNGVHDSAGFTAAYSQLVKLVRSKNPTAHIFLVVGSLISGAELNQWRSNVQTVMSNLQAAGDNKLHFVEFPAQDGTRGFGCDYHPSAAQHEYMASILVNAIKPFATLP